MSRRAIQKYQGSCHCGAVRFEIATDFPELGINVFCLHDFDLAGIPVRRTDGAAMS